MGFELVAIVIVSLLGVGYGTSKVVEVKKHEMTLQADKFESCVKYAESVRQCRNLED